jgi:hypothetical protein
MVESHAIQNARQSPPFTATLRTRTRMCWLTPAAWTEKVDLSPRQYHTLDEVWNKIYSREFGIDEQEYLTKKSETRAYKRAVVEAKQKGEQQPERPARAQFPEREVFDKRDERASQSIAQDDLLNATQRFDRSIKKVGSRIKNSSIYNPHWNDKRTCWQSLRAALRRSAKWKKRFARREGIYIMPTKDELLFENQILKEDREFRMKETATAREASDLKQAQLEQKEAQLTEA